MSLTIRPFSKENDCVILGNLCMTYATCNFCKAFEKSEYINTIYNRVKFVQVLDGRAIATIDSNRIFISEDDIMEYFMVIVAQPFRNIALQADIGKLNYARTIVYDDDTVIGFLVGLYNENVLDIKYLILVPEWHGYNIGYQFVSICINELKKHTHISRLKINISKPYTDTYKITKFLKRLGFKSTDDINFYHDIERE